MIAMAEDRGTLVGLVRTHTLEHAGAVVKPVRQYVHLGVLPGNELSVVPDEVRLVHDCSLQMLEDFPGSLRGGRAAPQVMRAQPLGQRPIDGRFYRRRLLVHAESV